MNKKLRYSFNQILLAASKIKCQDLHHKESQLHDYDVMCPAEYELEKHAFNVRKYMKDIEI